MVVEGWRSVDFWTGRLRESTAKMAVYHFTRWLTWMRENGGELADCTPDRLVQIQSNSVGRDKFAILNMLQFYVQSQQGTLAYKKHMYAYGRSFFMHNRAELPRDRSFKIRGDKPKNRGTLEVGEIRKVVLSCKPQYLAAFLCMFQGGMGQDEFCYWNLNGWAQLEKDLWDVPRNGESHIIKVDLPGRKMLKFEREYYTFIGPDAVEAIKTWLQYRPRGSQAIFTNQYGDPVDKSALKKYWVRRLRKTGIVEAPTGKSREGYRTGKGLHEIRDVFRTLWEKTPANKDIAEFMMGHNIDPLEYNKAYRDVRWARGEYEKALPFLNIMSSGRAFGRVDEDEIKRQERRVKELEDEVQRLENAQDRRVESLEEQLRQQRELLEQQGKVLEAIQRAQKLGLITLAE